MDGTPAPHRDAAVVPASQLVEAGGTSPSRRRLDVAVAPKVVPHTNEARLLEQWRTEEEARISEFPAPKLFDENVAPEHADSLVFSPKGSEFREWFDGVCKGDESPDAPHDAPKLAQLYCRTQCSDGGGVIAPLLFGAVVDCDLPMVQALLRHGAALDGRAGEEEDGGTPLYELIEALRVFGDCPCKRGDRLPDGRPIPAAMMKRSRVAMAMWLLSVGADVNASSSSGGGATPMHAAAKAANVDLFAALLARGGDARRRTAENMVPLDYCTKSVARKKMTKLIKAPRTAPPPPHCPCGSGRLLSECHDFNFRGRAAPDGSGAPAQGAPVHARQWCPCGRVKNSKRKLYGACCFAKRFYYRETLTTVVKPPTLITDPGAVSRISSHMALREELGGEDGPLAPLPPFAGASFHEGMTRPMLEDLAAQLLARREIHPAFAFAVSHPTNDFFFARPWTDAMALSKGEKETRKAEWNGIIDEWIAAHPGEDSRAAARATKVASNGGPLYHVCSRAGCDAAERDAAPGSFGHCAACKKAAYCSPACQKSDWKGGHKRACGSPEATPCTPSSRAMARALDGRIGQLSETCRDLAGAAAEEMALTAPAMASLLRDRSRR